MLHGACFENGCHLKEEEEKPPAKKVKIDATANGHHDTDVDGQESAKEMIRNRKRVVAAPQGTALHFPSSIPLHIVRGDKQYMFDTTGRRYLDTVGNVPHVGHCHEAIVATAASQMAELNTNTRFLNERMVTYAQKLTATFPGRLDVCFFTNSGSEANDLALQIAAVVSAGTEVISLDGCYHGHLQSLRRLSTHSFAKIPNAGSSKCIVSIPDVYRGKYQSRHTAGTLYAEEIGSLIERRQQEGHKISAFIHEPIMCCAGVVGMPDKYLEEAYQRVRAVGGLCIADEVQTGFGRVGKTFWAFELYGVCPDIVTLGKPMGNGHPVGAVITSKEIADKFAASGTSYFNTFGGNPVSMAISEAVLDIIEAEQLQKNAEKVGSFLLQELKNLQTRHSCIGDIRGSGFMIGAELVKDVESNKEPATARAADILTRMLVDHSIIIGVDGIHDNVIKIKPPMCFSLENAKHFVSSFEDAIVKTSN